MHDVTEAERCFWHSKPEHHSRAANVLKLANKLLWSIGEHLPKTGVPSDRFTPVMTSSDGSMVNKLVQVAMGVTRKYNNSHDPWFADTVVAPKGLEVELEYEDLL